MNRKMKCIIIILVILLITNIFINLNKKSENYNNNNLNSDYYNTEEDTTSNNNQQIEELTESEKMTQKIVSLFNEKLAFDTGSYVQGNIPAGEYAFIKFNGSGSYYCEKDGAGNIVDNENFDSFGYVKVHGVGNLETNGVLINITAFEKLGVKSAKEIYEILNNQVNWNQSGYYKVGVDIEPGNYTVESFGSGYWAILTGPVGSSEINDNDNFNGKASFNLSNGQYLELSRAIINKTQ